MSRRRQRSNYGLALAMAQKDDRLKANTFLTSPRARDNVTTAIGAERNPETLHALRRHFRVQARRYGAYLVTFCLGIPTGLVIALGPTSNHLHARTLTGWAIVTLCIAPIAFLIAVRHRLHERITTVDQRIQEIHVHQPHLQLTDPLIADRLASLLARQGQSLTITPQEMDLLQHATNEYNNVWANTANGNATEELTSDLYEALLNHRNTLHQPLLTFPTTQQALAEDPA